MKNYNEKLKIKRNVSLKNYTTFRIGGPAKYFFTAKNKQDLITVLKWAENNNLPFFILGGGSNLLVSDKGFEGIAIKMKNEKCKVKNHNEKLKIIEVEAGCKLNVIVELTAEQGLTGLEWAKGIPGTVAGAIRGNITAFGKEIKDIIKNVEVLDVSKLKIMNFKPKDCKFGFEETVFKKNKDLIILSAVFQLKKGERKKIKEKMNYYLNYRKERHPKEPSAGCCFKNCKVKIKNKNLLKKFPELKEFNKRGEIPSSYLIDKAGFKGKRVGGAEISRKHANFIVNQGGAKAEDVLKLISLIKKEIKKKFGIRLEEEIFILSKSANRR